MLSGAEALPIATVLDDSQQLPTSSTKIQLLFFFGLGFSPATSSKIADLWLPFRPIVLYHVDNIDG